MKYIAAALVLIASPALSGNLTPQEQAVVQVVTSAHCREHLGMADLFNAVVERASAPGALPPGVTVEAVKAEAEKSSKESEANPLLPFLCNALNEELTP